MFYVDSFLTINEDDEIDGKFKWNDCKLHEFQEQNKVVVI